MKRLNFLFILIAVSLMFSLACNRVKVIPEVSVNLFDEDVMNLTDKRITKRIIKYDSHLILVSVEGKIYRWNPEEKITDFLYDLNQPLDPIAQPFHQGRFLVVKLNHPNVFDYIIFDMETMKEVKALSNSDASRVLGVNGQYLVYLTNFDNLVFYDYRSDKKVKQEALQGLAKKGDDKEKEKVFNCVFTGEQAIVLSSNYVHLFSQGALTSRPLKFKAVSGFLNLGNHIYYGSNDRRLVKLSYRSGRVQWRFKLADILNLKPITVGPYIVVIPNDNNIYFFNKNGTLFWWKKLDSTRRMPPIAMNENAVVFLWDNHIKFFNYKKKRMVTYPLRTWTTVNSNPVFFGEYIYFVSQEVQKDALLEEEPQGPPQQLLSKVGNNYGLEIDTEPKYIWLKGKSISFTLDPFNLIEPNYTVKIYKPQPENTSTTAETTATPIYETKITYKEQPEFLWIPRDAANYKLVVEIDALNKKGIRIEENYTTIDVDKLLKNHYYRVQAQDQYDYWTEQDKEKDAKKKQKKKETN